MFIDTIGDTAKALLQLGIAHTLGKSGNLEGCATAVLDMAESAFERDQHVRCIELSDRALKRLTPGERARRMVSGRLALLQSRAYWHSRRIEEAKKALRLALDLSPREPSRVHDMTQELLDFFGTLERSTE